MRGGFDDADRERVYRRKAAPHQSASRTASPQGEAFQRKNAPLQNTAGRRSLCYFDAQAEQLAQEAQSGCSSAQMRSAEGVHWSA